MGQELAGEMQDLLNYTISMLPHSCTLYISTSDIPCFLLIGSKVHMLASTVSSKFLGALAEVEGFQFEVSTPMHSSVGNTLGQR